MNFFSKCLTGFIIGFMFVCMFLVAFCHASEFKLIDLDEVKISYTSFFPGGRDPLISYNGLPDRSPDKQLDLHIDSTIANYLYWNSTVHSLTDQYASTGKSDQFRVIGLHMTVGLRLTNFLDVYYDHFSQHMLDTNYVYGGFPVTDGIGFNLYLYRKSGKGSVF